MPDIARNTDRGVELGHSVAIDHVSEIGKDFVASLLHAGIESPWTGAAQLVNRVVDANVLPELYVIDAPAPAEFGSARWHAQQIGGAVGVIAPFFFVNKGVGALLGRGGIAAARTLPLGSRIGQAGLSGALYDGVLHPVQPQDGDFWSLRARNALTGAATFATLASVSARVQRDGLWHSSPVAWSTAGVPAGIVNAQMKSLLAGNGFASGRDTFQFAYGFMVAGGVLGALHQPGKTRNVEAAEKAPAKIYTRNFDADFPVPDIAKLFEDKFTIPDIPNVLDGLG